eukprot:m.25821 g.25821  ORF g.25821 m.25821 type:complete len:84 (+) comp28982_c0_seq2:144-395(+)
METSQALGNGGDGGKEGDGEGYRKEGSGAECGEGAAVQRSLKTIGGSESGDIVECKDRKIAGANASGARVSKASMPRENMLYL